jgi:FlaA1/EpsC-like NDP-sugar epimerase/lipopolysaccharide/colanic/teichoic acid biosynthesis glycosyltransferase
MSNTLNNPVRDFSIQIKASSILTRPLDLTIAALGLLVLAPLFLIIGLSIKFTSRGPIFYKFQRVGKDGRLFGLYKFRTTYCYNDHNSVPTPVTARFTPLGRFLRRTLLDSLPELFNVFYGDMRLIGPRPEKPEWVACYTPSQRQILTVTPGLVSFAWLHYQLYQPVLAGATWSELYQKRILPHKLTLDLAYLQRRTAWTDLSLMLKTMVVLIIGAKRLKAMLQIRNRHFLWLDTLVLLCTPALALTLRLDGLSWWPHDNLALLCYTLLALSVKLLVFYRLGLYRRYWCYANIHDLYRLLLAVTLSTTILELFYVEARLALAAFGLAIYRTIPLLDGLLTGVAIGSIRFGLRGLYYWYRRYQDVLGGRRVLVVGAGEAGTTAVQEMRANPQLNMEPLAFVDDALTKVGAHIQNLPVLGTSHDIPHLVVQHQIQQIVVAIPSAPLPRQREVMDICQRTGVPTDSLPGIYELLAGSKSISPLPKIDLNRLLPRKAVKIDQAEVAAQLRGATVLVTGAGGSIGSELCRQIARLGPQEIILLGHGENSIFEIALDLRLAFPHLTTHPVIVDVRDQSQVNGVVKKYHPAIIFHAAAHKHVPFMESNVEEALTNNVLGTWNVLRAAEQYEVKHFTLISSDKAVNPTCVMGATKRLAELLVQATAQRTRHAYAAVRFGNVLGSRGSVIPIFQRQIAAGGPITITHPDMRRFFMTIPEAVQLVLQTTVLSRGGEVFVLDMGQQVRIVDLATELIKLSGLEPERDIKIVYSGVRPGEKLSEELFLGNEAYRRTRHPKIFVAISCEGAVEAEIIEPIITELLNLTQCLYAHEVDWVRLLLPQLCYYIDQYQPHRKALTPPLLLLSAPR